MTPSVEKLEALLARVQSNRQRPRRVRPSSVPPPAGAAAPFDMPEGTAVLSAADIIIEGRTDGGSVPPSDRDWNEISESTLDAEFPKYDGVAGADASDASSATSVAESVVIEAESAIEEAEWIRRSSAPPAAGPSHDSLFPPPSSPGVATVPPAHGAAHSPAAPLAIPTPVPSADSLFPAPGAAPGLHVERLRLVEPGLASGPVARVRGDASVVAPSSFGELVRRSLALRARAGS